MRNVLLIVVLFGACISVTLHGQTFVGEVFYGNSYQYVKVVVSDTATTFSVPYLDDRTTYPIAENIKTTSHWTVQRDFEIWQFNTAVTNNKLEGTLLLKGVRQPVLFYEQQKPLPLSDLPQFEGVFEDTTGNRVITYAVNGYLHLISPFSGRSMSLKPIDVNTFWSVSGEMSIFESDANQKFTTLTIKDRFNTTYTFRKLPPIQVEEAWIPIGKDTLYAKIYVQPTNKKQPACLLLPGGGATGMANYEYEARYFAAHGMVSMVFDKSGNGKSKGPGNFNLQTFEEKNTQYLALFEYLRKLPSVDASKVGVHGPSEGGRLALMMAIDEPAIAFVNATAAPIMSLREGQLYAVKQYLRNRGLPETDNVAITNIWNEYYEGIIAGAIDAKTIEKANLFRNTYERLFLPPNSVNVPASPNKDDLLNDRVVREAGAISCPVFLQYGENDKRVYPEKSLENFVKSTKKELQLTIKLYPRANHSFMTPEYEISHNYLEDKRQWLQQINIL